MRHKQQKRIAYMDTDKRKIIIQIVCGIISGVIGAAIAITTYNLFF